MSSHVWQRGMTRRSTTARRQGKSAASAGAGGWSDLKLLPSAGTALPAPFKPKHQVFQHAQPISISEHRGTSVAIVTTSFASGAAFVTAAADSPGLTRSIGDMQGRQEGPDNTVREELSGPRGRACHIARALAAGAARRLCVCLSVRLAPRVTKARVVHNRKPVRSGDRCPTFIYRSATALPMTAGDARMFRGPVPTPAMSKPSRALPGTTGTIFASSYRPRRR